MSLQKKLNNYPLTKYWHSLILGTSFWILSIPMTTLGGSLAAFLGCVLACRLINSAHIQSAIFSIRTGVLLVIYAGIFLTGLALSELLVDTKSLSLSFSPIIVFQLGEIARWFTISLASGSFLRTLAVRHKFGTILEFLFVATAFVLTLAAHRNGMIHRPFFIGDFAQIRGIDPSTVLLIIGCGAVLTLSALLLFEQSAKRILYHFSILTTLCLSLFFYVNLFGLPTPQTTDSMGLTGHEAGYNSQNENPFRDGENENSDREAPVAVVVFRDDYEPLNGAYYFRESAYSQFNGTMLSYSNLKGMDSDLIKRFPQNMIETSDPPPSQERHQLTRTTVGMLVPHKNPFGLESPVTYQNRTNPNNLRFKRTYDTYSLAPEYELEYLFNREIGNKDWSDQVLAEYLKIPDDERYKSLATELLAELKPEFKEDPFAKAWTIKNYLDQNGIYSLKNQHAYESDPAASFLFGDLTGYCMHFSFAATYLFRSIGIPARVGIGYSVPASNRAGGSALLIQAIHGHAWPEVYFKDIGWVIIDPAPQQTLVDMTTDPQDSLQRMLGDMLRNEESFQEFMDSQRESYLDIATLINTIYLIVIFALAMGYMIKAYRLSAPKLLTDDDEGRLHFRAILDRLSSLGVHRQFGESRERFALRACSIAPSITEITKLHLALVLGQSQQIEHQKQWRAFETAVVDEIKLNTNWRSQLLALLNPFSWLLTK